MKIISGGQTGVDQIGLAIAQKVGFETGGVAPYGFRTEAGCNPKLLKDRFGLIQHDSREYNPRTLMNIINSDITLLFGNVESPGSKSARKYCSGRGKRIELNPSVELIRQIIADPNINVINIAGNRESMLTPELKSSIIKTIYEGFTSEETSNTNP